MATTLRTLLLMLCLAVGVCAPARATDLLLHFDGTGSSFADSSGNSYAISAFGNVAQTTAQSKFGGSSAFFDGTGDFLRVGASSAWDLTGDFTVDFWMNPQGQTASTNKYLFQFGQVSVQGWEILNYNQHIQVYQDQPNETQIAASTSVIASGAWTHVAVTRASGTLRIFINGIVEATAANSTPLLSNDNPNQIGTYEVGNNIYDYQGYLDEVRILNGAAAWTSSFTPPTFAYGTAPPVPEPGLAGLSVAALVLLSALRRRG